MDELLVTVNVPGELQFAIAQPTILCGPNSSGKTSILNAMANQDIVTLPLRGFLFENGERARCRLTDAIKMANTMNDKWQVAQHLTEKLELDHLVTADKLQNIVESIDSQSHEMNPLFATFDMDEFRKSFFSAFPRVKSRLVGAKRRFVTPCNFPYGGEDAEGTKVLESLFYIQNKRTDRNQLERLKRLEDVFKEVTGGVSFAVELVDPRALRLLFEFEKDGLRDANECGLGLQDVLVILFNAVFEDCDILLIEEVENHIHPVWQKRLVQFLAGLKEKYVVLTTHSSSVLAAADAKVFVTEYDPEKGVTIREAGERSEALRAIGNIQSDFLTARALALVEGPDDENVCRHFLAELGVAAHLVAFMYVAGDNCKHFPVDFYSKIFDHATAFLDSEIEQGSVRQRKAFKVACERAGVACTLSARPTIEHYFPSSAYEIVFPESTFPSSWDDKKPVWEQCSNAKDKIKKRLAELAEATPWDVIEPTDLGAFLTKLASLARAT